MKRVIFLSIFFSLVLMGVPVLYGMEKTLLVPSKQHLWICLPSEVVSKIFACADLATKAILSAVCKDLSSLKSKDFIHHSPLILPRQDCIYYMVQSAKKNDEEVFKNLLRNALHCDYADLPTVIQYFLPKNSEELSLLQKYIIFRNASLLEKLSPCIMTVYTGSTAIIDQYLTKNMKYLEEKEGMNPLNITACHRHPTGVAELLLTQNNSLLNIPSFDGWTPLPEAVFQDNEEMCKFLLSYKEIKTDMYVDDGHTVLHIAVMENNVSLAQVLLNHGCDVNILTTKKETPLWLASRDGYVDMVKLLIEHKADLEVSANDDTIPVDNLTPLCIAIIHNNMPVIKLLIEASAHINDKSESDNFTPLSFASALGNYDVVNLLLQKGAQVDVTDYSGYTSLIETAMNGNFLIFKLLLEHGANINHRTHDGQTALLWALSRENKEIVTFLCDCPELLITKKEKKLLEEFLNRGS